MSAASHKSTELPCSNQEAAYTLEAFRLQRKEATVLNRMRSGCAILAVAGTTFAADAAESILTSVTITEPTGGERVGAGLATIDVTGIPSMDGANSPNNVVIFLWVGPFNYVTGVGWDVVLQTLVPNSRRRDIVVAVKNTLNDAFSGFGIQPGAADPTPGGPTPYSSGGIIKLADQSIPPVQALADGLIRLEFGETRDNAPGDADAVWVSGTISLQAAFEIPSIASPGSTGILAVASLVCLRRNRARNSPRLAPATHGQLCGGTHPGAP